MFSFASMIETPEVIAYTWKLFFQIDSVRQSAVQKKTPDKYIPYGWTKPFSIHILPLISWGKLASEVPYVLIFTSLFNTSQSLQLQKCTKSTRDKDWTKEKLLVLIRKNIPFLARYFTILVCIWGNREKAVDKEKVGEGKWSRNYWLCD